MSIYKPCDIRGVVGEEWDQNEARQIGRSLGQMLSRRGESRICVGGDFRRSTPALQRALIAGLVETGICVLDLGQLPTPVVYFGARLLRCSNAAIVTASHNAGKYNGIKFQLAGRPAVPNVMAELQKGLESRARSPRAAVEPFSVKSDYEIWVVGQSEAFVATNSTRHKGPDSGVVPHRPRILIDTMNGAMAEIALRAFRAARYCVQAISTDIDPDFSTRAPNPANDTNLAPLRAELARSEVDLALALDGDGDRVIFVDPVHGIVRPEQIAVLLLRHFFQQPTVVYDLKCASIVQRAAWDAGGTPVMRPSGHGFIKTTMIDLRAEVGVEVSGHHFFGVLDGGDDGLFTALVVAGLLRELGVSLADLVEDIGWPAITPDVRIPYDGDADRVVQRIAATCGVETTQLDGVRAEYPGGWALARASITERALTFRMEGRDPDELRTIAAQFLAGVPDLLPRVLEEIDE